MNVYECCKKCEFRHYLCHADCPEKAKADAEHEARKKAAREDLPIKSYAREKKLRNDNKLAMSRKRGRKKS